jgi:7-cyano-7-deazaguanine reductase
MPDPSLLEIFPTPADAPIVIEHIAEEFTSLCPKTGHPDFGVITLRYQPATPPAAAPQARPQAGSYAPWTPSAPPPPTAPAGPIGCVELKSLKLYYQSFRDEGIFYEAVTHRIKSDLVAAMQPVWLQVITDWRGRGGIRSTIRADYGDVPAHFRGC